MKYFVEMIFEATKICQNGNERKVKKSVFTPVFYSGGDGQLHYNYDADIEKAIEVLKENHFSNIKHIATKNTSLLFVDTNERG